MWPRALERPGLLCFEGRTSGGAGREQAEGDERSGGAEEGARADQGRGDRVPAPLVHGHRGASEELRRDATGTVTLDEGGYFAMTTMDAASELRQKTVRALETVGIPIEYVHHEVGPSQHEIDMRFAPALTMADHTVTYRLIVKEIAKKAGYHATFMPKPIFGENGSGMHTHQSLFSDGRNAFFDGDDQWHLSDAGKAFIAGQLRHAREISAVFAQWVNSYKRLVPGYEA